MQVFTGPHGSGRLWFDNLVAADGTPVSYDPLGRRFVNDAPQCANRQVIGCNWTAIEPGALCRSCAMTALVPDGSVAQATANWARTEAAKRWVLDNLGRWGWFRPQDAGVHPVFHLLAEGPTPVQTGHADGVVTISVAEADPVLRTARREALHEPYRTLIGHLRHEIAHVLWWRLSVQDRFLRDFRQLFGDERLDYPMALQDHYRNGPPRDWEQRHLSEYASAHPHEDWAETAAHLLHLTDFADSFTATGLSAADLPGPDWNAYAEDDCERLVHSASAIAMRVNHINRSMGLPDLYPFVLSPAARRKLAFVHRWLREAI